MATDEKRVALVIGNAAYEDATLLSNPLNDAKAVAAALKALGFDLITVDEHTDYNPNLGLIGMARALADFSVAAESARTAVFYFAGHGLEVDGQNYLLPKDARLSHVRRMYFETIKLADVRAAVEHASHLRLVLLDACRNDPFHVPMRGLEGRRSVARGFASIEPSGNTGVAYAAKHGTTASDGPFGGNSPFAAALVKHLPSPDLEIRLLFGRIKDEVVSLTGGGQEPHFYSNFGGQELFLNPSPPIAVPGFAPVTPPPQEAPANHHDAGPTPLSQAQALWIEFRIGETEDPELIEAYIRQVENAPLQVYKARQRMAAVEALLRQRENAGWDEACAGNTEAAFQAYLARWPSGAHVNDARARINMFREDAQWQAAVADGTVLAFHDYRRDFPRGRYEDEARRRIAALDEAERLEREARERAEAAARAKADEMLSFAVEPVLQTGDVLSEAVESALRNVYGDDGHKTNNASKAAIAEATDRNKPPEPSGYARPYNPAAGFNAPNSYQPMEQQRQVPAEQVWSPPTQVDLGMEEMAIAIEPQRVLDIWTRYNRGDRNAINRGIYNPHGQQTFDKVRRRYDADNTFQHIVDRYVADFENLLRDAARSDPKGHAVQDSLVSDTGRIYLLLAHAAGRLN